MSDFLDELGNFLTTGSVSGSHSHSSHSKDDSKSSKDDDSGYDYRDAHGCDPSDEEDD